MLYLWKVRGKCQQQNPPWSAKWYRPQSCGKNASLEPKAPQTSPCGQERTSFAGQCVQVTSWEQNANEHWGPLHPASIAMQAVLFEFSLAEHAVVR